MHARTFLAGLATSAVAVSALALTASPALAATDADDTTGTPDSSFLVTVGSDTSQHALKLTADAYNATNPATKIFTYAATGGGQVALASGAPINRPNGSGAGKNLLHSTTNDDRIAIARSSSGPSGTENQDGLQMFPFAVDTLVTVTANTSNAPASLTPQQIVGIYDGTYTNWSQLGGTPGLIAPKVPQGGSGTRSFFQQRLDAIKGSPVVITAGEVQEHDPTEIQNNPNAIAPFSLGRAGLAGTVRVETGGFSYDRALYNVVRASAATNTAYTNFIGTDGFLCSAAAKPLIEQAGFKQLFRPSQGGVCGVPTQTATTNFTSALVTTTTTATATSPAASQARVVARVAGSTAPSGTVSFFEGTTPVASNIPLVSGAATANFAATPGAHTYRAVYTPAQNTAFVTSEGTAAAVNVLATSTTPAATKETIAKSAVKAKAGKVVAGKKSKLTVSVKGAKPTGKVVAKLGKKNVGKGTFKNGKAKINLKAFKKPGVYKVKLTYAGNDAFNSVTKTVKVKVTKAAAKK
jgi:ABC-type phosphate transport system substrate-binding protein